MPKVTYRIKTVGGAAEYKKRSTTPPRKPKLHFFAKQHLFHKTQVTNLTPETGTT